MAIIRVLFIASVVYVGNAVDCNEFDSCFTCHTVEHCVWHPDLKACVFYDAIAQVSLALNEKYASYNNNSLKSTWYDNLLICPPLPLCNELEDHIQKATFKLHFINGYGNFKKYDFCFWGIAPSTLNNIMTIEADGWSYNEANDDKLMVTVYKGPDWIELVGYEIAGKFKSKFSNVRYVYSFYQYFGDSLDKSIMFTAKSSSSYMKTIYLASGLITGALLLGIVICTIVRIKANIRRRNIFRNAAAPRLTNDQVKKKKEAIFGQTISTNFSADKTKFHECLCTICLVDFKPSENVKIISNCKHIFHEACLLQWIDEKILSTVVCPNCKLPIIPGAHSS